MQAIPGTGPRATVPNPLYLYCMDIKNNILETIGNTPMIRLNKITRDFPCTVVAKVDYFNPGNSIKDRMAVKMIEVAEKEGKLKPGGTIIEGTSGNKVWVWHLQPV
jgi:cystathionine beta-synthase